ncbi:hypothetical protein M9H77_27768 [Catharanthus roseus]|uniref:Uncharacterized protein n=1 Tax=Catharanthus roseus TaxID=4058 RepID=A0ACC0ADM6_CATRO|nr:hypothetical protein M9H77_27768 [Catharanthus roseus]
MGSELCPWTPTFALYVLLNSGVEAALMCLDSLKLPSCAQTPHVGSNISGVKATKEKCFLITLHELFLRNCIIVLKKSLKYTYRRGLIEHSRSLSRGTQIPYSVAVDLVAGLGGITGGIRALDDVPLFIWCTVLVCGVLYKLMTLPPEWKVEPRIELKTENELDISNHVSSGLSIDTEAKVVEVLWAAIAIFQFEDYITRVAFSKRIALYMTSPSYEGLFRWRGRFKLGRVDPIEEGRSTVESLAQSVYVDIASCSAMGRPPCGESRGT